MPDDPTEETNAEPTSTEKPPVVTISAVTISGESPVLGSALPGGPAPVLGSFSMLPAAKATTTVKP